MVGKKTFYSIYYIYSIFINYYISRAARSLSPAARPLCVEYGPLSPSRPPLAIRIMARPGGHNFLFLLFHFHKCFHLFHFCYLSVFFARVEHYAPGRDVWNDQHVFSGGGVPAGAIPGCRPGPGPMPGKGLNCPGRPIKKQRPSRGSRRRIAPFRPIFLRKRFRR